MSTLFDYPLISWVTNYTYNPAFFTCLLYRAKVKSNLSLMVLDIYLNLISTMNTLGQKQIAIVRGSCCVQTKKHGLALGG